MQPPVITVIGGGMIVHDQILPSLYQLQREGKAGGIAVCARQQTTLDALAQAPAIASAFPGHAFGATTLPYADVVRQMPPRQIVVVALPDQLHNDAVMRALDANQHVLCVKPLVLTLAESFAIEREATARNLVVAIEYHKRFDDRSLLARRRYREGLFGEFKLGTACLMEKWHYRNSNFQNWFSKENSDAFSYIGCHYVDLVHFITGLYPMAVSVYGIPDRFPNGTEGYLWTDARVLWNNGACLNVQNSLSFPDDAPGSNTQGVTLYCSDGRRGALLKHSDQYRGLEYATVDGRYSEPSPDYMQYVEYGGPGLKPVGYGYRSIAAIVESIAAVEAGQAMSELIATPANSRYNEAVVQAARTSLAQGGALVNC